MFTESKLRSSAPALEVRPRQLHHGVQFGTMCSMADLLLEQQPAPTICRDLLSGRSHSYPAAERSSLGDAVTDDLATEPRVGEWSAPERPLLLVCRLSHERLGEPVRPPRRPLLNPSSGSWPSAVGTPSSGVGCCRGRGRRPQSPR